MTAPSAAATERAISGGDYRAISGGDSRAISGGDARKVSANVISGGDRSISGGDRAISGGDYRAISGGDSRAISGGDARKVSANVISGGDRSISGGDRRAISGGDYRAISGGDSRAISGGDARKVSANVISGGDARRILILRGPVEAADAVTGKFTILGQSFADTSKASPAGNLQQQLLSGAVPMVSVYRTKGTRALHFVLDGSQFVPGQSKVLLTGTIKSIDVATAKLSIGTTTVDYSSILANRPGLAPSKGERVRLTGTQPVYRGVVLAGD